MTIGNRRRLQAVAKKLSQATDNNSSSNACLFTIFDACNELMSVSQDLLLRPDANDNDKRRMSASVTL